MSYNINYLTYCDHSAEETINLSNGLAIARSTSIYRTPYLCNVFEQYNSSEPITSWALSKILSYKKNGENIFLKSFVSFFLKNFDVNAIKSPMIITEGGHVDILIKEKGYCIIIENKLKGAIFQQNQIARYIKNNDNYSSDKTFIVLLPKVCVNVERYPRSITKSVWKLPSDYKDTNGNRLCSVDKYQCLCDIPGQQFTKEQAAHCKGCIDYYDMYSKRTVTIHSKLAEWLMDDCISIVPDDEPILKSFIIQFADFLKLQYNTRESEQLIKEMKEYLKKELKLDASNKASTNISVINDKINDVQRLLEDLQGLRSDEYGKQIEEWYLSLKQNSEFSHLIKTDGQSFGILIQGIWCGCWYKDNKDQHPYWGFFKKDSEPDEKDRLMVLSILSDCDMEDEGTDDHSFIKWGNTENGAEVCLKFYYSAKKLGYI